MYWGVTSRGSRTAEQRREHYIVEKALADRLRQSSKQERQQLYSTVYDELFRRVPHHPQLTRKADAHAKRRNISRQMAAIRRFLGPGVTYLEVGPGDCGLALEVAKRVKKVYAIEVSTEITKGLDFPSNFELVISDGSSIPVERNVVDVVYSNQLMEHLHPDDALCQLSCIYEALKDGGIYICVTPNAMSGPHDISRCYDDQPTGLHMREYTVTELVVMFRSAGFTGLRLLIGARGLYLPFTIPVFPIRWLEAALARLPSATRRRISYLKMIKLLLGINLIATK